MDADALERWEDEGGRPCTEALAPAQKESSRPVIRRHTDREYEAELADIKTQVITMGAKVQEMVDASMQALLGGNEEMARQTIALDDGIDDLEREMDERCLQVLARRQPVASDLRFVTTVMKMVTDLERTADMAVHISERSLELHRQPLPATASVLSELASLVQDLLGSALLAFAERDTGRARDIIERDRVVDTQARRIVNELSHSMRVAPDQGDDAGRLQSVINYLERIGDHATNLAEMVVFMVEGKDIRHVA